MSEAARVRLGRGLVAGAALFGLTVAVLGAGSPWLIAAYLSLGMLVVWLTDTGRRLAAGLVVVASVLFGAGGEAFMVALLLVTAGGSLAAAWVTGR
jgi:hypothetical protein